MPSTPAPPKIFVSYSHHDMAWRESLFGQHLCSPLGDCPIWTDSWLRAGDDWADKIEQALDSCGVAVLLVSPRFLKSEFITQREFPRILARAQAQRLRIVWIPVAVGPQHLSELPELGRIQGATRLDEPLPGTPGECDGLALDAWRERVRVQMLAAVDPLGAELSRRVAQRYAVGLRLGEGSRAAVYLARDRTLERTVAIKVLKDGEPRESFMLDVMQAVVTSEEPNFLNVYDVAGDGQRAHCVMQHIEGRTLRSALLARGPERLSVQAQRRIFVRLATAITRAHALNVTYGNLKPSNIILDRHDEPFVLPVGRRRDPQRDALKFDELLARVAAAQARGEPPTEIDAEDLAYLVPDHFGDAIEPIDLKKVDQYMLGLLAWEMATGRRPQALVHPQRLAELGRAAFADLPLVGAAQPPQAPRLEALLYPQRLQALLASMTARRPRGRLDQVADALQEPDLHAPLSLVIARDSYRRCAAVAGFDSEFFACFYGQLQQACPESRALFQAFTPERWARQHAMLKEAVLLLFAFRQQGEGACELNVLSRTAASHGAIPARWYPPFAEALVRTVCGDVGSGLPAFDPVCQQHPATAELLADHWGDALAPGIAYLQRHAAR